MGRETLKIIVGGKSNRVYHLVKKLMELIVNILMEKILNIIFLN